MKNYGFNVEKERLSQDGSEWIFGGFSEPCIASIPEEERQAYLPDGELQRGKDDMQDCASRGPINILEAKFTYLLRKKKLLSSNEKWLRDMGYVEGNRVLFSDAFIAIKSGTTRSGNSIKAPLQAIENHGLIPKKLLPLKSYMTWDEYHDPKRITEEMVNIGKQFKDRFQINYEKVLEIHYKELLKDDMLNVAGFAWPTPQNGVYPRIIKEPNHVWVNFMRTYFAFDNYIDTDGDYIKHLAPDYDFYEYGYRVFINRENNIQEQLSKLGQILKKIGEWLGLIIRERKLEPVIEEPKPEIKPELVLPPLLALKWGTKEQARHSVRVLCDMEGLSVKDKNLITAVIDCESGFDTKAVNKNKDGRGSIDYGIIQANSYWYIGKGKPIASVEEALNNPEKCVRVMIQQFKKGRLKDWVCYKSKAYQKYL